MNYDGPACSTHILSETIVGGCVSVLEMLSNDPNLFDACSSDRVATSLETTRWINYQFGQILSLVD